jgi:hypothetical protein
MVFTRNPSVRMFRGYLRAGTQWPQVRGILALAILQALFSEAYSDTSDRRFSVRLAEACLAAAKSNLSEMQIETAFRSANTLHVRAGINVREDRLRASLPYEWRRSFGLFLMSAPIESWTLDRLSCSVWKSGCCE